VREFLSARNVSFVDRNIRQDPQAKEDLLKLTGKLVVPVVVMGEEHVVGYDPDWLERLVSADGEGEAEAPPRDSLSLEQGGMAARPRADLAATLADLLGRVREELAYNAAKGGGSPYRKGMHDGLRFAEDALLAILQPRLGQVDAPETPVDVSRLDA
jgi:glutaredoxin